MNKYIWPSDVSKAARWYLQLLKELSREVTLDNFIYILGKDAPPRKSVYACLQRLCGQGLLVRRGTGHSFTYKVSSNGIACLEHLTLFDIKIPSEWDKSWRLVIFDIPESSRAMRDKIRLLLKELGFTQLQLSVWIHPFPCFEQFRQLQKAYGVNEHLHLIEITNYSPPLRIKDHFRKKYPEVI